MSIHKASKWLFFSLLFIISLCAILWQLDYTKGDANGLVKGVRVMQWVPYMLVAAAVSFLVMLFSSKTKLFQNIGLSLVMSVLTYKAANYVIGKWALFQEKNSKAVKVSPPRYPFALNEGLGYSPPADSACGMSKKYGNTTVYNMAFKTDSLSNRITPAISNAKPSRFFVSFGCSFTFGEGLADTNTIAYNFQNQNSTFRAYNLGYSGYGLHQALAKIEMEYLPTYLAEKEGIGIFTYIPDHVNRSTLGLNSYLANGGRTPQYIIENELAVRKGFFSDVHPLKKIVYDWAHTNAIMNYFKITLPIKRSDKHFEAVAIMAKTMAIKFKQQTKASRFVLVLYPSATDNYSQLIPFLVKHKVDYLNYSQLFDPTQPAYAIPNDGHPSALANKMFAAKLAEDLL
jgi:hypothetical protein